MAANRITQKYFTDLDEFLRKDGIESIDAFQHSVERFQFTSALSIPAIGLFEIFIACLVTVVFSIPTLAVWLLLIVTGFGLTSLRIIYSKIKRHRWAKLLREWEEDHSLAVLAQFALDRYEEPPRELSWFVRRSPSTTLDWCINYVKALIQTRDGLLGTPGHAGQEGDVEHAYANGA